MEELIKNLKDYVTLLDSEFPKDVSVNIFQKTFMDFAFRNREIIKAVIKLLDSYENEDFLFLPLASILRLLSTDTLTIYYLITFLSDNLREKQITFENELNALRIESIISMDKIIEYENELGLTDIQQIQYDDDMYKLNNEGKKVLKNRKDFHLNSNPKILKNYNKPGKFLSEEAKIDRIKEFIENDNVKRNIYSLFKNYKYLTFYYHYTPIGGRLSRTFDPNNYFIMQGIIKTSILSIISITRLLEFIQEDVTRQFEVCFDEINKIKL